MYGMFSENQLRAAMDLVEARRKAIERMPRHSKRKNPMGKKAEESRANGAADQGQKRRGIRAADLVAEASIKNTVTSPRYEYPAVLITSCEYIDDDLTALDQAIYHYLVARLRMTVNKLNDAEAGAETTSHFYGRHMVTDVAVKDLIDYTGIRSLTRLRDSLARIADARVRYDLRRPHERDLGIKTLVDFENMPPVLKGSTLLTYSIDCAVRSGMARARRFVMLDLNALTQFKSRYTIRLYCWLAIRSTHTTQVVWRPKLDDLVAMLGYPTKAFHRGNFAAHVMRAVDEIKALPDINRRFEISCRAPEGDHGFRFLVGAERKSMYDVPPMRIPKDAFFHAEDRDVSTGLRKKQFVRARHVGYAASYTKQDALSLSEAWRRDIAFANDNPNAKLGTIRCGDLTDLIERYTAPAAFEVWVNARNPEASQVDDLPLVIDWSQDFETTDDIWEMIKGAELEEVEPSANIPLKPRSVDVDDEDAFGALLGV